ncbi:MAG: 3-phenylpropionate/trans-cinnamate dioxygenase ferredoxin reductase component [Gaiellales bacterium]|jgi:3-phenylpropionate/trans-cinnamate dioxygenase ferredoxin reductase subunit|nr:3-phenylpropionate/trans-cinnamate dioxygenase ferredoxin reductase component [Gaiellales bacterium]
MARYDHVIVGGGLAGGMIAQEYREAGGEGSVLIVGREQYPPYHRPPLTKEFLRGEKPLDEVLMRPAEEWAEKRVDLRLGTEVTSLDTGGHTIELGDGERVEYGSLALATGATPRALPGTTTIRTLDDSQRLGALLERGSGRIGVIGGGFIGVEGAASARMKGFDVTMAVREDVVWEHMFGAEVGRYFQGHLERGGVEVLTGTSQLPDPDRFDVVLAGIGVTPNIELAQAAGIPTDEGVLTDECLQAAPHVWAVGDIAEYQSVIHGRRIRIEHWDVALNHGSYVGRAWAGVDQGPYDVVPYFFSDIGDWTWMEYVGPGGRDDTVEVRGSMENDDFVAYYTDADGKLTACLGVNRSDEVNQGKELIAKGAAAPA